MAVNDLQRSRAQLEDAARRIDAHRRGPDTHPEVAGAHAAIEWLLGRSESAPVTGRRYGVEGELAGEANSASMASLGLLPVDPMYATGADAVLFWALGIGDLPGWVRVIP